MMSEEDPPSEPTTGQRETKPKKVITRNVAVALGIICIVLVAGLGSAIVYYTMTINGRDQIVNLTKSTVWVDNQTIFNEPVGQTTDWAFNADYAGYISVQVYNSTAEPSANVIYSYQGINYNQILSGTTEVFPVMPTSIEIHVGNGPSDNLFVPGGLVENYTITITYYY
jgi:hypothetical protein